MKMGYAHIDTLIFAAESIEEKMAVDLCNELLKRHAVLE